MLCITYLLSRHMATEHIRMPTRTEIHMRTHNMRKTLGEEWTCAFGDMLTDKQTDMLITTVCSHISICCRVWIFSQFHRIMLLLTCKICSFLHTVYCCFTTTLGQNVFSLLQCNDSAERLTNLFLACRNACSITSILSKYRRENQLNKNWVCFIFYKCLQCFDAVGWAAGRASGQ